MGAMAGDSSFDVVSVLDRQEVDNALNQAAKEVRQRFDFKGTDSSVRWSGDSIEIASNGEARAKAVLDVLRTKLIRRGVDLRALDAGEPRLSGKVWRITCGLRQGIGAEDAKRIGKLIRDSGPKGVRSQTQGDAVRVFAKKRDDLQAVQRVLREADLDFPVQFVNYR